MAQVEEEAVERVAEVVRDGGRGRGRAEHHRRQSARSRFRSRTGLVNGSTRMHGSPAIRRLHTFRGTSAASRASVMHGVPAHLPKQLTNGTQESSLQQTSTRAIVMVGSPLMSFRMRCRRRTQGGSPVPRTGRCQRSRVRLEAPRTLSSKLILTRLVELAFEAIGKLCDKHGKALSKAYSNFDRVVGLGWLVADALGAPLLRS